MSFSTFSTISSNNLGLVSKKIKTPVPVPNKPNTPNVIADDGKVTISWMSVSEATGYNLQYSPGTIISNITSPYTLTGLINNTLYTFAIQAYNSSGSSDFSSSISATPLVFLSITTTGTPTYTTTGTLGNVDSYYIVSSASSTNNVIFTFNNPKSTTKVRLLAVGTAGVGDDYYGGAGAGAVLDISFNFIDSTIAQTINVTQVSLAPTKRMGGSPGISTTFSFGGPIGPTTNTPSMNNGTNTITNNFIVYGGAAGTNPDRTGNGVRAPGAGASNCGNPPGSTTAQSNPITMTYTVNSKSVSVRGNKGGISPNSSTSYVNGGGGAGSDAISDNDLGLGGSGKSSDITGTSVLYGKGLNYKIFTYPDNPHPGIFILRILSR
jgi:hypothetical protein